MINIWYDHHQEYLDINKSASDEWLLTDSLNILIEFKSVKLSNRWLILLLLNLSDIFAKYYYELYKLYTTIFVRY